MEVRSRLPKPYPVAIFGGMLEYIPELGGSVWHANNWQMHGTWLHDFDKDTWKDLKANGGGKAFEKESPEPEQIGYYDPARKMIVVQRHHDTHHYDVEEERVEEGARRRQGRRQVALRPRCPLGVLPRPGQRSWPAGAVPDEHRLGLRPGQGHAGRSSPRKATRCRPGASGWRTSIPRSNALVVIDGTTVWAYRYKAA